MKIAILNSSVVGGLLAVTAQAAFCQGTIYTSRPAFESALGLSTIITFEGVSPPNPSPIGASSITTSGVTFSNPWGRIFFTVSPHPIPGTGQYLWHFDGVGPVDISLPGGITAFGADLSGGIEPNLSYDATLTVNLAGGLSYAYNLTAPRGVWTFFGITFTQPIASVVYDDGGPNLPGLHEEMLDKVTFGSIPEPSVLGLFAFGGLFLGWRRFAVKCSRLERSTRRTRG